VWFPHATTRRNEEGASVSDRPRKRARKREIDPRLEARRLMEQFIDVDEASQVSTRDIAVRVATAWALVSIADSLATSNLREGLRGSSRGR
jgi:hypothetical protein